jgi:hypothetical protein
MSKINSIQVIIELPFAGLSIVELRENGLLCSAMHEDKIYNYQLTWSELGQLLSNQFNTKQL